MGDRVASTGVLPSPLCKSWDRKVLQRAVVCDLFLKKEKKRKKLKIFLRKYKNLEENKNKNLCLEGHEKVW